MDATTTLVCNQCGLAYRASLLPHECAEWTKGRNDYDIEQGRIEFQKELTDAMVRAGAKEVELPAPRATEQGVDRLVSFAAQNHATYGSDLSGKLLISAEAIRIEHSTLVEQRDRLLVMLKQFVSPKKCYCDTLLYDRGSRKCGQCEARELIATIEPGEGS